MALRPDWVLDRWEVLLEGAAGQGGHLLELVEDNLASADPPGGCAWESQEGWQELAGSVLLVRVRRLPDVRGYIVARDYGVHLQASFLLAVEPGWLKRIWAERIHGDSLALSLPRGIAGRQELGAFAAVVRHSLKAAADDLLGRRRGRGPLRIRRTDMDDTIRPGALVHD